MLDKTYQNLKASLMRLGPVVPGRLREVTLQCGKKNCHCQTAQKTDWHGPYVFWDRVKGRRLASRSITPKQAKVLRLWIQNRKEFERIVRSIYKRGLAMADRL